MGGVMVKSRWQSLRPALRRPCAAWHCLRSRRERATLLRATFMDTPGENVRPSSQDSRLYSSVLAVLIPLKLMNGRDVRPPYVAQAAPH